MPGMAEISTHVMSSNPRKLIKEKLMQFKSLKGLMLAASAIAGLTSVATNSQAADNATMNTVIEAVPALNVVKTSNLDFGRWLLSHDTNDIVLVMDTTGNVTPSTTAPSTVLELDTNASAAGRIDVNLPAGLNNYLLDMTVSTITDFADAAYTLSAITYGTATEGANQAVTADGLAVHPVTVVTGGIPEVVTFGATITVSATPTPGIDSDGSFTVTFAY